MREATRVRDLPWLRMLAFAGLFGVVFAALTLLRGSGLARAGFVLGACLVVFMVMLTGSYAWQIRRTGSVPVPDPQWPWQSRRDDVADD